MKVLAELTATAARSKDPRIAMAALDFWAQLAEEEEDRRSNSEQGQGPASKEFTLKALKLLVEMVFEIMASNKASEEEAEYGLVDSTQAVLQKAARAVGHPIVDVIMPFINANFSHQDPLRRDAAVMSFGLILEGPDKPRLQKEIILPALPHFLAKLEGATRDPSPTVRSSTAYSLSVVFAEHLEVLAPYDNFGNLVQLLCRALDDEPIVVKYVACALNNLITGMHDDVREFEVEEGKRTLLSPLFYHVINALMLRADKPDWFEHDLRGDCYLCITSVIEAAGEEDEAILIAFLSNCLQRLDASCAKTHAAQVAAAGGAGALAAGALSQEERAQEVALQEKVCEMINEMMTQVKEKAAPGADQVAAIMVRIVQAKAGAEAEAILCLATLTLVVGEAYERYMPVVYPLLLDAMRNTDEHATCKYAIMAISDLARALGPRFEPVAGEVVDVLKGILQKQDVMRSLKPPALASFADIAIALGPRIEDYLVNILAIVKSAAKTDIPPDDEDLAEYLTEVRKAAIEAWSGLLLAFSVDEEDSAQAKVAKGQGALRCLEPSLPDLKEVVCKWAAEWKNASDAAEADAGSWEPDFALLQHTVQILGDASQVLPHAAVQPYLNRRLPEIIWLCLLETRLNKREYPEDEPLSVCESARRAHNDALAQAHARSFTQSRTPNRNIRTASCSPPTRADAGKYLPP
jgi:importin subunit beta-1